jgi:hypothetical protein
MCASISPWICSRARTLILILLASCSSGCLCTFERDWRAAEIHRVPADNLAGLWEGTWLSHYNGHNGKLRAIITPRGNGQYRAQYKGTFAFIVPFAYETTHTGSAQPGVTYFSGRESLGPLAGGDYYINGRADGNSFVAHYRADKDHGVFRMQRVGSRGAGDCCVAIGGCDATTARNRGEDNEAAVIVCQ